MQASFSVQNNLFEVTKEAVSKNGIAAYMMVRHIAVTLDTDGWYDLGYVDREWEVFDTEEYDQHNQIIGFPLSTGDEIHQKVSEINRKMRGIEILAKSKCESCRDDVGILVRGVDDMGAEWWHKTADGGHHCSASDIREGRKSA